MKTVRELITRAIRLTTVHGGAGQRALPPDMAEDGLESVKGMYTGFIGHGLFGPLADVLVDADYTADENERVINTSASSITVTLPLTLTDAVTGLTRAPEDRAVVVVTNATDPEYYIYDADIANWMAITVLGLDDVAPLTGRFSTGLAALLAVHMLSEYGYDPAPILAALADDGRASMRLKRPRLVYAPTAILRGVGRTVC